MATLGRVGLAPASLDKINNIFPPLPQYGPPHWRQTLKFYLLRASAFTFQLVLITPLLVAFLATGLAGLTKYAYKHFTTGDPDLERPFIEEERKRAQKRKQEDADWVRRQRRLAIETSDEKVDLSQSESWIPTEGGPDLLNWNIGYYARRVGLDAEEVRVQTEDGFLLSLWHIYDPREYVPADPAIRQHDGPDVLREPRDSPPARSSSKKPKYPVLMMHGLLQSAGVFACNDDDSFAFWLCKSGYDVWLGDNRCGFNPAHVSLTPDDPRFWNWNIRHMGTYDLPAFVCRVLWETGFEKLAYIGHSQGTTQAFMALAKDQRPDLGDKISIFCALAPAAYSGTLLDRPWFKFCRQMSTDVFRICFGLNCFLPALMTCHEVIPGILYGFFGYQVFCMLFGWSNRRWDRGLLSRMFMCAPVYVSAESLRWWLGTDGFATNRCLLSTKDIVAQEEEEDRKRASRRSSDTAQLLQNAESFDDDAVNCKTGTSWFDERVPPMAFWICGQDNIVNGHRLIQRFESGREPHVKVVHTNILEDFNHLDVIWALDALDRVATEIRDVIWKTCEVRDQVRVPSGCEMLD